MPNVNGSGTKVNKQENGFPYTNTNAGNNIPEAFDLWKNMYYLTEKSYASLVTNVITTDTFSKNMMQWMNCYLDYEKISRKMMDQYFETVPVPSKNDIARVAKLVIGVEDKVDNLESSMEKNMGKLIQNLTSLIDNLAPKQVEQLEIRREFNQTRETVESMNQSLSRLMGKIDELSSHISASGPAVENNDGSKGQSKSGKRRKTATAPVE